MKYTFKPYHRNVPDKLLLSDLRISARRFGKNHITSAVYKNAGEFDLSTICKRFGSWNKALLKAGLKVISVRVVSDDELLANLKNVWDTLGRQPKSEEMFKPVSAYSRTAYIRHFGSWQRALKILVKAIKSGKLKSSVKKIKRYKGFPPEKKGRVKKIHITKSLRYDVFKRDHFKCKACGASPANDPKVTLHADHIKPASRGGQTILSNLQTLCSSCNYGKGDKIN